MAVLVAVRVLVAFRRAIPWSVRASAARPTIALVGPFRSANWVDAYAAPMVRSLTAPHVFAFAGRRLPLRSGATVITPHPRLMRVFGHAAARTISFTLWVIRNKPDVVVGFHLPWNGLVSLCVARLVGARAVYFCVGGIDEVLAGGIHSEHVVFEAMGSPSPALERRLVALINRFDDVLTMGTRTAASLVGIGVTVPIHPVGAAIDNQRFSVQDAVGKTLDVITVARLAPIKRLHRLIEALALLRDRGHVRLRAAIVGDGPQMQTLQALAERLGVKDAVLFCGWKEDVESWVRRARVFILTSKSEGLPISLLEAMSCGVPAIVPVTGDIEDVIEEESCGLLVRNGSAAAFADAIGKIVTMTPVQYGAMAESAQREAQRYSLGRKAREWSHLIDGWLAGPRTSAMR